MQKCISAFLPVFIRFCPGSTGGPDHLQRIRLHYSEFFLLFFLEEHLNGGKGEGEKGCMVLNGRRKGFSSNALLNTKQWWARLDR